jgi:hypothetical protein
LLKWGIRGVYDGETDSTIVQYGGGTW